MGRVRAFDTGTAVRAARDVFWAWGFDGASLPELEQATGLNRSSIYHAFGSKRGLFDAAVESYLNEIVRPRLRPLTAPDVAPQALERYLAGLRDALLNAGTQPAASGCLLINAACSTMAADETVALTIASYHAELGAALTAGVRAALPHLPAEEQARLGNTCTALVVSAFTLVRVDRQEAARQLDVALALVTSHVVGG